MVIMVQRCWIGSRRALKDRFGFYIYPGSGGWFRPLQFDGRIKLLDQKPQSVCLDAWGNFAQLFREPVLGWVFMKSEGKGGNGGE